MPEASNDQTTGYEPCIVTFIDVLGFRDLLLSRTAEQVLEVLNQLQDFTKPGDESEITRLQEARFMSRAYAFTVSDAIVRVRPYDTEYRDGALFQELIDLLHAQIELVNCGVLVRAGITVGEAHVGLTGKGPAFGPAIVRAYEIESNEAMYPRVVLDDHALALLETDEQLRSEDNDAGDELEEINGLLATGDDGTRFIDYLSISNLGEFDSVAAYLSFLQKHAELVRAGLNDNPPLRVRRKYEWLRRYHNSEVARQRMAAAVSAETRAEFLNEYEVEADDFYDSILV